MSEAIRLVRLKVQNVGTLREGPIEVGPFADGVNLITGSNECGKSTLVRALKVALFERHSFMGESVKALRPYGGKAAPQIEVELTIGGVRYLLEKRLLNRAYAKLYVGDDPNPLKDEEADATLLALLDAREGGKKGSHHDDMGVWGLLWVAQDGTAARAPTEDVGENVRSSLATAIEQQVGAVMGGADGVKLRALIEDEFQKFWTPRQDRTTGELATLQARAEALTTEVAELDRKVTASETLAADVAAREEALDRMRSDEETFVRELAESEKAERDGQALEEAARRAEAAYGQAVADGAAAEQALTERVELRAKVERAAGEVERFAATLTEDRRLAEALRTEALAAAQRLDEHRRRQEEARQGVDRLTQWRDALRARDELSRLEGARTQAREAQAELATLRDALRGLPDDGALQRIEATEGRRGTLQATIARTATRVVVERAGEEPRVVAVAGPTTVDLGPLGQVEIEPPRRGFGEARAAWRESDRELRLLLAAARVDSVSRARAILEERQQVEARLGVARERLLRIAPKGVPSLDAELGAADRELAAIERDLDHAQRLQAEVDRMEQTLAGLRVTDADARRVGEIERRLAELRRDPPGGVVVHLRALAAVRVQIGDRDTPRLMTPGHDLRRVLDRPTLLVVDERLTIELDPGTRAATSEAARPEALEAELARALEAFAAATVAEVFEQAALRTRTDAVLADTRKRLQALAPDGVGVVADRLERRRVRAADLRRVAGEAARLQHEIDADAQRVAAFHVTAEEFVRLDELDRRTLAQEQEVRRTMGGVGPARGALAAAWAERRDLLDATVAEAGDARVSVIPGEAPSGMGLSLLDGELDGMLKAVGAATVAEARSLHARQVGFRARAGELERALGRLAPRGFDALETEFATRRRRCEALPEAEAATPVEVLEVSLGAARQALADADARAREAETVGRVARTQSDEAAARLATAERDQSDRAAAQRAAEGLLASHRAARGDDGLEAAVAAGRAGVERAQAARATALDAVEAAMVDQRRLEVGRALRTLEDHRRNRQTLNEEFQRWKGELAAIGREGRYDCLAEKRVELDAAQAALDALLVRARALKLLRGVAEAAYGEAQRALMRPVYEEASPLLKMIRPGTTFRMNHSTLELEDIDRDGFTESFGDLSGGTREQLAVIVRIALARVFARQRRALPLILDDILGWTDEPRFRKMVQALEMAARDMQVILLTCHPARFARFAGAPTFDLERLKAEAAAHVP